MKVSYQWLQEYLDLDVAPQDLAEKIARTSVDINDVYSLSDGLKKIVVGEVVQCENHPDSDHLHVCQVDVGEEEPIQRLRLKITKMVSTSYQMMLKTVIPYLSTQGWTTRSSIQM